MLTVLAPLADQLGPLARRAALRACGAGVSLGYRLRVCGTLPTDGPLVVAANHVSFVDAPLLSVALGRPMRFVIDHKQYRRPGIHAAARFARAIPIAPASEDERLLEEAYDSIALALQRGETVCIFPEGRLSKNGGLEPFRRGIERIVERTPVPVVPVGHHGLWGSRWSRAPLDASGPGRSRFGSRRRVEVRVGEALSPQRAPAGALQQQVALLCEPVVD